MPKPKTRVNDFLFDSIWFVKGLFKYLEEDEEYIYLKALPATMVYSITIFRLLQLEYVEIGSTY
jgi:hypothetical protein